MLVCFLHNKKRGNILSEYSLPSAVLGDRKKMRIEYEPTPIYMHQTYLERKAQDMRRDIHLVSIYSV